MRLWFATIPSRRKRTTSRRYPKRRRSAASSHRRRSNTASSVSCSTRRYVFRLQVATAQALRWLSPIVSMTARAARRRCPGDRLCQGLGGDGVETLLDPLLTETKAVVHYGRELSLKRPHRGLWRFPFGAFSIIIEAASLIRKTQLHERSDV